MELTAFTSRLGEGQGWLGPGVFILGDDEALRLFELAPGDYVEVTQPVDLTHVSLVLSAMTLRVPASLPAGVAWEASLVVDGVQSAAFRGTPGRERAVSDLAANVSKLTGVHVVGVRLQLVPG
jgi:hypothetical protein